MTTTLDRIWNQIDSKLSCNDMEEIFMAECLRQGISETVAYSYMMGSDI